MMGAHLFQGWGGDENILHLNCVFMFMSVHMCVCVHLCTLKQRLVLGLGVFFFETGSLTEPDLPSAGVG